MRACSMVRYHSVAAALDQVERGLLDQAETRKQAPAGSVYISIFHLVGCPIIDMLGASRVDLGRGVIPRAREAHGVLVDLDRGVGRLGDQSPRRGTVVRQHRLQRNATDMSSKRQNPDPEQFRLVHATRALCAV